MKLQKKIHPKYQKPLSNDEKNKKKLVLKNIRKQKIIEKLYTLPLDIKIKIYQMAIINHMNDWNINHMYASHNTLLFIENNNRDTLHFNLDERAIAARVKYLNPDSRWAFPYDFPIYHKKTLCQKKVKGTSQDGIKSVFIGDNMNEQIDYRQWTNWSNYYWYHNKCRCKTCDLVRITGANHLEDEKEQIRFSNIKWDPWSDQWKPKSNLQLKYEKNMKRKKKREVNNKHYKLLLGIM